MTVEPFFRTIDLAKAAQISVQQVRNYEANGFLPTVERSPKGYRCYTQRHLVALTTTRLLIVAYGWQRTQQIMQATHQGKLSDALALVDARHAELHHTRLQLEQTFAALSELAARLSPEPRGRAAQRLTVGAAAKLVGVRVSALRFWEQQGLLHPVRERESNYRIYDDHQLRRLRIVALLRQAHYDFAAIRTTLAELEHGPPRRVVAATEERRAELARRSWHCVEALTAFHQYVSLINRAPISMD